MSTDAKTEPDADDVDELAGGNRGRMANDGNEISMAARLHLQDGEAVVLVEEGDTLDQSDQHLPVRRFLRVGQACENSMCVAATFAFLRTTRNRELISDKTLGARSRV
ncbi:hypothetical protein M2323_004596 [Rhodoblastus acidophilus]|nr:hypothetical protein [Rhodoblastus acidophilus]MCW2286791.1 hypothetical protein [Rhodoblastus acidophilus]MCW2335644.1 hypothetical protein [Rhodoblastus acidophilus]